MERSYEETVRGITMGRKIFKLASGHKTNLPDLELSELVHCTDENLYIGTPNGNKKIAYYDDIENLVTKTMEGEY